MAQSNKFNGNDAGPVSLRNLADAPANQDMAVASFVNRCIDFLIAEAKANELDLSAAGITVDFDQAAKTVTITDTGDAVGAGYTATTFTSGVGDGNKPRWTLTSGTDTLDIASPDQPTKNPGAMIALGIKAADGDVSGSLLLDDGSMSLDEDASGTTEDYTAVAYSAPNFTGGGGGDPWE